MNLSKKTVLSAAMAAALGAPTMASADIIVDFGWTGIFTMLDNAGNVVANGNAAPGGTSPNVGDAFGLQTGIGGTMQFNLTTGAGTGSMVPFDFFNQKSPPPATVKNLSMQAVGDMAGGAGPFIEATMLFDWNNSFNIPVSLILNGSGMFGAVQGGLSLGQVITGAQPGSVATTPSCATATGAFAPFLVACGPAPVWTTDNDMAWDPTTATWKTVSGGNPVTQDGISGTNMPNKSTDPADPVIADPFGGFNANFDFSTLTVQTITDTAPVPVPAAVWLFGSGLMGLVGVARRKKVSA